VSACAHGLLLFYILCMFSYKVSMFNFIDSIGGDETLETVTTLPSEYFLV